MCLLCCTLYIQFRLVRFHLSLDYIKLALFLFLFLTDFRSWLAMNVRLLRWLLSRGLILIFMSSPTLSLSSLCCNIFSFHDGAEIYIGIKFFTEVQGLFQTVFSTMIYQYDAEGEHQTAIVYLFH